MANLLGQPLKERGKASQNNPFKGSIHQISLHQPKFECGDNLFYFGSESSDTMLLVGVKSN